MLNRFRTAIFGRKQPNPVVDNRLNFPFPLLNLQRLRKDTKALSEQYARAEPFPHIVIDDFLDARVFNRLLKELPAQDRKMTRASRAATLADGRVAQGGKKNYAERDVSPFIRMMFWQLNSGPFLEWLEQLTGIPGLIADPHLKGGGLHVTGPGGLLRVHADFNKHPLFNLDRRVNFLLYLNEDWQAEYGGELELWDRDVAECKARVLPIANRCVVFSTSSYSFHGHPEPLTCPEGRQRKSLAMYYYSNGRPDSESSERHATLWPELPGEQAAAAGGD